MKRILAFITYIVIITILLCSTGCKPPTPTITPTIRPINTSSVTPKAIVTTTESVTPPAIVTPSEMPLIKPPAVITFDNQPRFIFGINYPSFNYATDFGESGWGHQGASMKTTEIENDLARFEADGFNTVRWFVFANGSSAPEFTKDGSVSGLDPKVIPDLNAAIERAQAHHLRLILVLLDFQWLAEAKIDEKGVTQGGHASVISDPSKRQSFFDHALLPLLEGYGKNPTILAWEVINEPEWAITEANLTFSEINMERVSLADMQNFVQEAASLIHKHANQQVTLGSASPRWWQAYWANAGLDLCQVHYYPDNENGTSLQAYPVASISPDQPCFVGEFPSAVDSDLFNRFYRDLINGGYAGALPWSLRGNDNQTDLASQEATIKTWALRLKDWIALPDVAKQPLPTLAPSPTASPMLNLTITPDLSAYGFEKNIDGWNVYSDETNKAVQSIERISDPLYVYQGQWALQMNVSVVGGVEGDPNAKGEISIDMSKHEPFDGSAPPYDFSNFTISCYVYVPSPAQQGKAKPWIAFQIFTKNPNSEFEYGDYTLVNPSDMDAWIRIVHKPRIYEPENGNKSESYDPRNVYSLGVKIAGQEKEVDQARYDGPVFIDSCSWK